MTGPDAAAARLDITFEVCPMTFVKAKLELEELEPGQLLEVLVREGEPLENVKRACTADGHSIAGCERDEANPAHFRLTVRRGG